MGSSLWAGRSGEQLEWRRSSPVPGIIPHWLSPTLFQSLDQNVRTGNLQPLLQALGDRFAPAAHADLHRAELRARCQIATEPLSEYREVIRKLTRLAYPTLTPPVLDTLAKDQFISGIYDRNIRLEARRGTPATLDAALILALQAQAIIMDLEKRPAKRKACRFLSTWTLPPWIAASSKGLSCAYCKLCKEDFTVTHGGFNDVKRHVAGKGHQKHYKEVTQNHTMESFAAQHVSDLSTKIISAEVAMCNFIAQHNLSFSTADHLTDLLPKMFPDSKIVAGYACKRTKTTAIIGDALEPHFLRPVVDATKSLSFSLPCDESNVRGDTEKLLTILVRIFEEAHGQVTSCHLETVGIADFSANGIFTAKQDTLLRHGLAFERMVSFASDTCNVMKGSRGGVIANIRQEQPKTIDIHCNCHVLNLAVKSAIKALPLKVDELLVDTFYHFHHSVKRIVSLQEYADFCNVQFKIMLCHIETRWLSLGRSISCTLEMWEPLCAYFTSHPDVEKNGKVKTIAAHWTALLRKCTSAFC